MRLFEKLFAFLAFQYDISPPIHFKHTQTPKYQTHRFDIHVFLLRGESRAINANIRLAQCFIVMLPSARIDRKGCPIHIMHRRSISNGPRIGAAANISSLWEQGARGCNGVECRRWLSECAKMVIEGCKHVPVKNPDDLLSLFQDNHATLGQFFSAIYSKADNSFPPLTVRQSKVFCWKKNI